MALSPSDAMLVRHYCGYPAAGMAVPTDALAVRLATLSTDEEALVLDRFLPVLDRLEAALAAAGDTLDTAAAAVWKRNPAELAERAALYRERRLALCAFLGVDPGPGIPPVAAVIVPPGGGGGGETPAAPWEPPAVLVV